MSKLFIYIFSALVSALLYAEIDTYADIYTGINFVNSKSLNKITEGFNAGYAMDFGKIRFPVLFSLGMGVDNERWKYFITYTYGMNRKSSYSNIYEFTQKIGFTLMPLEFGLGYKLFWNEVFSFYTTFSASVLYSSISLTTDPSVSDYDFQKYHGWGFIVSPASKFTYLISPRTKVIADVGLQYIKTGRFKYNNDTDDHSKGEEVSFADGSYLTLNLMSIKFLIGIQFNFL